MNKKVLIVGPAWVGDMVMAQSLFKLIKAQDPQLEIDVLAPAWSLPLLSRMPEVSGSIVMPFGHGELKLRERYHLGKSLRAKQYDQAIVLPNSFKSALVPFFAKIPKRTGWVGEMRYGMLNDVRRLDKKRYALMIERFMALALPPKASIPAPYPLPSLMILQDALTQTLTRHQINLSTRPILALCPGAEFGPAKRWPESYYAEVANEKIRDGWDVWLFGSPKDSVVADMIMTLTQQRCVNFTGKTQLEEAIDLLSLATAVVTNDSGLMHIAAALQKPLVAIYGPTSTAFTPPLNAEASVVTLKLDCQPCFQRECPLKHHRCMKELTPQKVIDMLAKRAN